MGGLALIFLLPLLAYCAVQTVRDLMKKNWPMGIWGALLVALMLWTIPRLFIGPQH